jgi:zinc and cadmium transporter
MTLVYIVLANMLSNAIAVAFAGLVSFRILSSLIEKLVPVSAGLLLTTAITHLVPESFNSEAAPVVLGWTMLAGILGLFMLEKLSLFPHSHHHEGDRHHHGAGHDARQAGRGGIAILIGDAFHGVADGVTIAGAFLIDTQLGIITTLAIVAHEIPHEVGEFMVLMNAGFTRRRAIAFNLISGMSAVVAGVVSYFVLDEARHLLPYVLALAASSLIYVALSDLLPEMMRRSSLGKSLPEVALVLLGVLIAGLASSALHAH